MPKITLEFETDLLAAEFYGWYLDGGGEDAFSDALACRNVVNFPEFCEIHGQLETRTITHTLREA